MIGFSYDPVLSARTGASLSLVTALVLAYRSALALSRPYRKTETWLILEETARPPKSLAQRLIGSALREAYAWYGRAAALATIVLGSAAQGLSFLRTL
jgi:hypothetical protein